MSKFANPMLLLAVFAGGIAAGHLFDGRAVVQAQSDKRVFELRTYTAPEGKLSDLHARFRNHTVALFQKHGITNVAYWVPQDAPQSQNTLVYMIAYPNRAEAKKRWAEFQADPDWKKALAESQVNGPLQSKVESLFLDPLDFSPMK
jgi:NIPSNAP protein